MSATFSEAILERLLVDSNGDGFVDGVVACFVPLAPSTCTPALWAAMANLAARLGLESPAIHMPLVCHLNNIAAWQVPLFISFTAEDAQSLPATWTEATDESRLVDQPELRVCWLTCKEQRGLWLYGTDQADIANFLNEIATSGVPTTATGDQQNSKQSADLDLATLYSSNAHCLFRATNDGFMPDDTRFTIALGPQTDAALGQSVINLAARLGLETTGLTFPLVTAHAEIPATSPEDHQLLLGFSQDETTHLVSKAGARQHQVSQPMAAYLADTYPFLSADAQKVGDEEQTLKAIVDHLRDLLHAHAPLAKLALAEVQANRSLHLLAPGSAASSATQRNLDHIVFRREWNPPDGLDDPQRLQQALRDQVIPLLQREAGTRKPEQITLFCNAPVAVRQTLANVCRGDLAFLEAEWSIQVLPAHKAGLAWLLETQLPILVDKAVSRVTLYFREFRPQSNEEQWLDLPTRWLQELFPADELLAQRLGLSATDVDVQMLPMSRKDDRNRPQEATYRLEAFAADGTLVHSDELHLLWDERHYLSGLPQFGLVHPSTGGFIIRWTDGEIMHRQVPTDYDLFWDFYQGTILPGLRQHLLTNSGGRPTPEREPYFNQLQIDVVMGEPDQPLDIYEEFISLGEALHEDLYFNTLDYLAALGEAFGGCAINAAGQVVPWVHDYYGADGQVVSQERPRAVVTLHDALVPLHLPDLGLTVGDRRDMPQPTEIRVRALTVDDNGSTIRHVALEANYPDAKRAHFAARVLAQWCKLVGTQTGFPCGVTLEISCRTGMQHVESVTIPPAATPATIEASAPQQGEMTNPTIDSAIIGPDQLLNELDQLGALPGIHVWQVGRSYQGRPGHVIDLTLPLEEHQTHWARHKLSLQKPTLLFVARHHANEVSSTTTALQMARAAATDPNEQQWLHKVNLVFLPMANPDGAALHYALMQEHPRWKHHAARFNAAGKEFGSDHFDPTTPFGEARFRRTIWQRWLPDAIVDNHGVPSHEWCQPFAGYTTPPRFPVCYHVLQAMLYGIITFVDNPTQPHLRQAADALRTAVAKAVAATPWLHARNQYWLERYHRFGHRWLPEISPLTVHEEMLFFYRGVAPEQLPQSRRNFAMRYPQITLLDWVTEVPDETAQGDYLIECAEAHRVANQAMIELLARSAAPVTQHVQQYADGRISIGYRRSRQVKGENG